MSFDGARTFVIWASLGMMTLVIVMLFVVAAGHIEVRIDSATAFDGIQKTVPVFAGYVTAAATFIFAGAHTRSRKKVPNLAIVTPAERRAGCERRRRRAHHRPEGAARWPRRYRACRR